jgi:hypothetical protein
MIRLAKASASFDWPSLMMSLSEEQAVNVQALEDGGTAKPHYGLG